MDCRQLPRHTDTLPAVLLALAKRGQHLNQIDFFEIISYSLENEEGRQPEFLLVSFIAGGSIIIYF